MEARLTIVIPAYNEEDSLKENISRILKFAEEKNYKVTIVNDGSIDDTASILKQNSSPLLNVINHKINKGYGTALKNGILNSDTEYLITFDADGQHRLEDVEGLMAKAQETDADMVVGSRNSNSKAGKTKSIGKAIIRWLSRILIKNNIKDLNSGMKLMRTDLAKKYSKICPDNFAFSDVILLIFLSEKNKVIEAPITINERKSGKSKISIGTAFETVMEIVNITVLFNPMKIFLPVSLFFIIPGFLWSLRIVLLGRGVSVGGSMLIVLGIMCFLIGLLAEQLSFIKKSSIR